MISRQRPCTQPGAYPGSSKPPIRVHAGPRAPHCPLPLLGPGMIGSGMTGLLMVGLFIGLAGCAPSYPSVTDCQDKAGIHVICGLQNPEDMALLPGEEQVILSQFGSMDGTRAGNLALFDIETETVQVVFRGGSGGAIGGAPGAWGDPSCPGPPNASFSPHGIDLAELSGQGLRLLVVNHGGRESVEFFEVNLSEGGAVLTWRGCAIAPEQGYLNDVVSLPGGGFLVTHMMPRDGPLWGIVKSQLGFDTGHVYEWEPGRGFRIAPGTTAPFPNGIEVSADGRSLYLNIYSAGEVRQIDRQTGEILGSVRVPSPDNATWARDGRLLVASHAGGLSDQIACMGLEKGACGMEFSIVAVDPISLKAETLFRHAGAPMGAGTVALDLGDGELLIGSFAADRMLRVRLPLGAP
ncbi:MAG TPA: hypothetical protein EYQ66_04475 [Myxococcales bacterium]|nr:hypothetical protein [Myxococcales bacterium]